jgi:hypothetical protein
VSKARLVITAVVVEGRSQSEVAREYGYRSPLRDLLGQATYESLARKGETMTTAAMVTYAFDQIDQARAELEHSH